MTNRVIGINGGGTHTTFVLMDAQLQVLARAEGGPSNPNYVGLTAALNTLRGGLDTLLLHIPASEVAALGVALAGVDRPGEREAFTPLFEALFPGKPVVFGNDALAALIAGVGRAYGMVVIAGTGMIALGINEAGERARAGGWGHFIDQGSGYAMAREALHAVARAHDGSGPATELTARILAQTGAQQPTEMIPWLYASDRRIDQIAALAAEVVQCAAEGDLAAISIITHAAHALTAEVAQVAHKLGFDAPESPVVPLLLSGSLFTHSALLRELFTSNIQTLIPNLAPFTSERDAAMGSGSMALEALGQQQPIITLPAPSQRRATERRNPLTMNIHRQPSLDLVTFMNLEDARVPAVIARQLPHLAALIDDIAERFAQGGRIFITGAGTSGRLAVLDAAECGPTFSIAPDQVEGIIAGGERAILHAVEGAEDDEAAGRAILAERQVGPQDSVIGVAASGSTPFVRGTLLEAAGHGALTACIVNVVRAPLIALVQHPIVLPTGPEALTGSTRLKAGSAQKMALNIISTGVMVRVGRTFGNLMTHMQASNRKLRGRAITIVSDATGLDEAAARALLERCDGDFRVAIASALLGLSPDVARERLNAVHGNLNKL